ncbi:importin-4-like [Macrosteles quadrilineatus]|uniref:importin-4-like n=1 Tax=Macrosteles quadrilineatus TaxID=74068 RepID=UPI0023E1EC61|nr:importin-4-like [Macrosteles quadrilineatus]
MDTILNKLITPDTNVLAEGTNDLREAFKSPDAVPSLCSVIGSSPNMQIRKLAAVILRKKLAKHRYWLKLPTETRQFVKQGLMQSFINDTEKQVKTAIGQVIGVLAKHEFPENGWPELMQFLQQKTQSENINDKELGFFLLCILTDIAADQFLAHAHSFATLFASTLGSLQDIGGNLAWLTVLCMTNFVPAIQGDQHMVNTYHALIPTVMAVVQGMAPKRSDHAIEVLCLIDELCDEAVVVLVPHLRLIIETCLQLAHNPSYDNDLQIKALNIVGMLVQSKKKQIVKLKLVEPILDVVFALMCIATEDEEEYPDMESSTPTTVASQTLDLLALHLPPDKLLPTLMQKYIEPSVQHQNPSVRNAAYMAMALVSEGCSEYIRQKYIKMFIDQVLKGLQDPATSVQNAALFAVGQFSEFLQPDISVHATQLVPFLLEHLQAVSKKGEEPSQKVEKMFYALDTFCENLDSGLLQFLPMLMTYLIPLLSPPHPVHLRELAICTVGSCASAAKEGMMPYFQSVMESLRIYLTELQPQETMCLQVQSVDTLGTLARSIGSENFLPMAKESMELGIQLISKTDDPDLRKSVYGLFASVACVLRQDMNVYLPTVMDAIVKSVKSDSGMVSLRRDENNPNVGLFETISDGEESEEDLGNTSDVSTDKDEDDNAFTVENSYLEEKEEAIVAIKDLAQNCMESFLPYVDTCFQEIFTLINFPHDDVRSAALTTLAQLCINIHKIESQEGRQGLLNALNMLVPKCAEIIRTDREREVVIVALEVYSELLKEVGAPVLEGEGHTDAIINCIKDVLNSRTECQDEGGDDTEEESEGDEVIVESAGEIVPLLGKVMAPQEFSQHYTQFIPMFFNLTRKQASDAQRSFGVGMLADCMSVAGPCLQTYAQQLLTLLLTMTRDNNAEVRNNAIFALGELVYHGRDCVFPFYGEILHTLSTAVATETNPGALDNICGALARLIITNTDAIPLQQVVPVYVRYLPLREDFEENKWIYQSLGLLYQRGCEPLLQNLPAVISSCAHTLHNNHIEAGNRHIIVNLLKSCHRDFPAEINTAASLLPEDVRATLQQACVS